MPRPYSDDLRWRMVYQRFFYQRSYEEIASQLFVCRKTVYRTINTFLNSGDVKPYRLGRPTGSVSLFDHEEYIIMDCILRTPQIQLHEIANYITNATGSSFSPQTLCQSVYRLGITRRKVRDSHVLAAAKVYIEHRKLAYRQYNVFKILKNYYLCNYFSSIYHSPAQIIRIRSRHCISCNKVFHAYRTRT